MKISAIKYILFTVAVTLLTGCDDLKFGDRFLEKPLSTEMNLDSVFSKKIYADQVLAESYRTLPDFLPRRDILSWTPLESMTDLGDVNKPGGNDYYKGIINSASAVSSMTYRMDGASESGRGPIWGIRQSYIYIENVDRVSDMSQEEKNIRKAEAKLIIAYHFTQIFRNYGGMMWIDHAYRVDEDFNTRRLTVEEMVTNICNLCDEAARVLPWRASQEEDGRMTAAGALALKVRLLLFAASPLFNSNAPYLAGEAASAHMVWYGNYSPNRWQKALDAGLDFLTKNQENGNAYALVNTGNPREDFVAGYFNRYNGETLISARFFNTYSSNMWPISQIRYGVGAATLTMNDMYQLKDGTPFSWENTDHYKAPYFDAQGNPSRDVRLYETLAVAGDKYSGRIFEPWLPSGRDNEKMNPDTKFAANGFAMRKFIRDRGTELNGKFYNCPLIRLPEIYLSIAEAMNELGQANTADKFGRTAYDYIDMVRSRVAMPGTDKAKYTPGESLKNEILWERAREFAYEEVRYFDINRWKRVDLLQMKMSRLIITKENNGSFTYEKADLYETRKYLSPTLWSPKYYLTPLPIAEVNKNYGLIQNPGW